MRGHLFSSHADFHGCGQCSDLLYFIEQRTFEYVIPGAGHEAHKLAEREIQCKDGSYDTGTLEGRNASKSELSGAQGRALHFILAQTDDVFQKDIEEEYGLRPPTATELLKKMENNGLIRREVTSYDARLKRIISSDKALRYKVQVVSDLTGLEEVLTAGISPEGLDVFFKKHIDIGISMW